VRISIRGAFASFGGALALVIIAAWLSGAIAADLGAQALPGGWSSVGTQNDQVVLTAKFAVQEHVRQTRTELKLMAIKHARQQVVAGINFSMNLIVQSEGRRRLVIAVVWVKRMAAWNSHTGTGFN
jgi:hypothetical protein